MQSTYEQAIAQVFKDEGGYTNESTDPGGPTNWGITLYDAQTYWKHDATSEDVKSMPKSVAEDIYRNHYAIPVKYDSLPAGVDYAVLDYAINSGISRSSKLLQHLVGVTEDGIIGSITIAKVNTVEPTSLIKSIYTERLAFLKGLHTWSVYGHGWTNRCTQGLDLALSLAEKKVETKPWYKIFIEYITNLFNRKGN